MITVIIPTHNRGTDVIDAVDSVLASTQLPGEIIVVEDQSDEAQQSLADYISSGKLRYYRRTDGISGASATRNFGVSKATQQYILFLDDDDTIVPTYIEKLQKYFTASSYDWGFGDVLINGEITKYRAKSTGHLINTKFKRKMAAMSSGFWINKELYEDVGGLDELLNIDEDTDLCCRLIANGLNPFYLKEGAVNLARNDGNQRLTTVTDLSRKIECYYRTLVNNYDRYANDKEAQGFLLDRVHRVMCKRKDQSDLPKLKAFSKTPSLRVVHFLRELKRGIS